MSKEDQEILLKRLLEFLEISIETPFKGINLFHNFVVFLILASAWDKFIGLYNTR